MGFPGRGNLGHLNLGLAPGKNHLEPVAAVQFPGIAHSLAGGVENHGIAPGEDRMGVQLAQALGRLLQSPGPVLLPLLPGVPQAQGENVHGFPAGAQLRALMVEAIGQVLQLAQPGFLVLAPGPDQTLGQFVQAFPAGGQLAARGGQSGGEVVQPLLPLAQAVLQGTAQAPGRGRPVRRRKWGWGRAGRRRNRRW